MSQNKKTESYKVLSLFSGCGGMDLGFEGGFPVLTKSINPLIHSSWIKKNDKEKQWTTLPKTKFKTIFANDIKRAAKASWVPYFANRGNQESDFKLASIVDLVKEQKLGRHVFPNADVITGGFPCQDFSVAGKRLGFSSHKGHHGNLLDDIDDPSEENRGKLYMWMRHAIEIVLPKVFIAENVKGLVSLANTKKIIENDFRKIGSGYLVVDAKVLYAPNYGIPQSRERVIFIGFRKDALNKEAIKELSKIQVNAEFDPYPKQTHGTPTLDTNSKHLLPFVTVRDCLYDLPEPHESNDLSHQSYSKAKWYGKHVQGQIEVKLDKVGPTIRSEHHGNIEFRRLSIKHGGKLTDELKSNLCERRLSVRECARIQTFPDDFEFVRNPKNRNDEYKISVSDGYKLVGNAVPPLLAYHIANRLQELWPKVMK